MTISIHAVTTIEECQAIERLQAKVWGCADIEVTPSHFMLIIAKEGGIVLLAVDEAGQPVGFSYSVFALTEDNRLKLASHQTGVLPVYQNSGLGYHLKLAQREAALACHLDLITWTFDPLQGRNAYLNLHKLGAVCNTYLRHLYGDMPDALNRGLPSDRFQVEWWITSEHVEQRLTYPQAEPALQASQWPIVNSTSLKNGFLTPPDTFGLPDTSLCLVEVPPDLPSLKARAPDLALAWRLHTRKVFERCFANNYTAVDFVRGQDRNYYLLQKEWQPE